MSDITKINLSNVIFLDDAPSLDGYDDETNDVKCVWNFELNGQAGELVYRLPEKHFDARIVGGGKIHSMVDDAVESIVSLLPEAHRNLITAWNEAFDSGGIDAATTIHFSSTTTLGR